MRVYWLLVEMGLDFECVLRPFDRSLREPGYAEVSPAGRVPALEDGEVVLFESGAIVEYLCERYPEAGFGRLPGDPERWAWLTWLHFAETIAQHLANLTQQHIMLREDWMRSPTLMKLERLRLEKTLQVLETALDGRQYLLASGFCAVDACIGYCTYVAKHFTHLDRLPNTHAYFRRLSSRPAFRAALPPAGAQRLYTRDFYPTPDA